MRCPEDFQHFPHPLFCSLFHDVSRALWGRLFGIQVPHKMAMLTNYLLNNSVSMQRSMLPPALVRELSDCKE